MFPSPRAAFDRSEPMTRTNLLIFDCDGVLIDSEPIASRTLAEALSREYFAITTKEAHAIFTGNSETAIAEIVERRTGLKLDRPFLDAWHDETFAAFRDELAPMDGIETVLDRFDIPKCVASNSSPDRLANSLGLLPIWRHFAPNVFSADMVARPKPAPDLPLYCLDRMGARAEHAILIDDSTHGIEAARAAGVRAIGFVDPEDPRPGRARILADAGALRVAVGTRELERHLHDLICEKEPCLVRD